MIQKCPNCGTWFGTEGGGMLQRFGEGIFDSGEKISKLLGGDNPGVLSRFAGHAFGLYPIVSLTPCSLMEVSQ